VRPSNTEPLLRLNVEAADDVEDLGIDDHVTDRHQRRSGAKVQDNATIHEINSSQSGF
jgi:phosphomannomutase